MTFGRDWVRADPTLDSNGFQTGNIQIDRNIPEPSYLFIGVRYVHDENTYETGTFKVKQPCEPEPLTFPVATTYNLPVIPNYVWTIWNTVESTKFQFLARTAYLPNSAILCPYTFALYEGSTELTDETWVKLNAKDVTGGNVLVDRNQWGMKTLKIKYTYANVTKYTNEFVVDLNCPSTSF